MSDSNPFLTEKAWEVSGGILPAGDHVVEVISIDGAGDSSGGYPQLEISLANDQGSIRDWLVVIDSTIGKVVQLTDAAGLERPTDEHVVKEAKGYRLSPSYLQLMVGKQVGAIVREEPDRLDPTKTRTRVQGYVKASFVGSDATPAAAFANAGEFSGGQAPDADEDIPF